SLNLRAGSLQSAIMRQRQSFTRGGGCTARTLMGISMRKMALLATALAMFSVGVWPADMVAKAVKAPPPPPFEPWDFAFGSALMSDYIFRGITQSNHKPSVAAYFEPRYNINKDVQLRRCRREHLLPQSRRG